MKDLLEQNDLLRPAQVGKIVEGKVVGKARSAVFLDLGPMGTGIIYGKEFLQAKETLKNVKIGETIFAKITDLESEDGYVELSLNQASNELTWGKLIENKEKGEKIKVKISGANKGGLLTEVLGIPAFLPVSQLMPEHYPRVEKGDTLKIAKELQQFLGQELEVKVFDLDPKEGKLILSERAKEDEKIKELLEKFKIGQVVQGEITGVTDFGVFIKFPAEDGKQELEGLIHISELDWQLIEDPADIVKLGDKVKAKIIDITRGRVSLSLKALKKDPWEKIEEKFKKGDIVEGKVTKLNPFGAFIQIAPNIQGLCHISELTSQEKMKEKLEIDKKYKFEILSIEAKEHKMSLKLVG